MFASDQVLGSLSGSLWEYGVVEIEDGLFLPCDAYSWDSIGQSTALHVAISEYQT